jgi:cytochrome c-type biogenesis protein CcmH
LKPTAVLLVLLLAPLAAAQTPPDHTPVDLAHVESIAGPPRAPRLTGAALEAEAKHIAAVLRCPVCQGLSVGDSPSAMATNMRQQIRELVAAGFDEDQILSYFEASYGEFVRLQPPLRGVNWLVWIAPGLGLLLGLGVVSWVLRGASTETPEAVAAAELPVEIVPDPLPDDPALAKAVLRVRELAYGWPGGVRPGKA